MQHMLCSFPLIMNFLATLTAQMLLTALTKHCFYLLSNFFTFLAKKLNFVLMPCMVVVADWAAYLLAGGAPEWAFGLLFAALATQ